MNALTTQDPVNIVQITDTHLYGGNNGTLLKMNTRESYDHVIKLIQTREKAIDCILATGDIAQDASKEAYQEFLESISCFDTTTRWIPGNHDNATTMAEVASGTSACEKIIQINNWMIILLDSSILGQVHGTLASSELEFLKQSLASAEENAAVEHCLVCLHHNPVPGNAGWMKDIGLNNGAAFFKVLKKSSKAGTVLYGHIHQQLDFQHQGIRCLCSPSSCIQFKSNVTNLALDKLNPGYRWLKLYTDGRVETEVVRVSGEIFEADFSSPGY
ncbi:MAG: 3',5'-cyclic-AMP phosphodiesterase [Gammaproteobacteria bacterium]|nr:3',5'-cyclic-AMP phosphodiesterase [Gammaproteobacteria bacterium]